jgi:tetratricopeptide (TPR) repeat protein
MALYGYWSTIEDLGGTLPKVVYNAQLDRISEVAGLFGSSDIAETLARSLAIAPKPGTPPEQFAVDVAHMVAATSHENFLGVLEAGTKLAFSDGDVAHLRRVGAALTNVELAPSARADALSWLSSRLRGLGDFSGSLELIEANPAKWEADLSTDLVAVMELERSQILDGIGNSKEAWDAMIRARQAAILAKHQPLMIGTAIQHGSLLRASGRLSEARDVLEEALAMSSEGERSQALSALAGVLADLGMHVRASDMLAEARSVRGTVTSRASLWGDLVSEAAYRFMAGQVAQAQLLMKELPAVGDLPSALLTSTLPLFYLAAVHGSDRYTLKAGSALIDRALVEAEELASRRATRRARYLRRSALSVASKLAAERRWEILDILEADAAVEVEADVAAHSLERVCDNGDIVDVTKAVVRWRLAVARDQGGGNRRVQELDGAVVLGKMVKETFDKIWAKPQPTPALLQIINDAQRNILQRSNWLRRRLRGVVEEVGLEPIYATIPSSAARFVSMGLAPFAVLEWLWAGDGLITMVTRVEADGLSHSFPNALGFDVSRLAKELTLELSTLTPALSGPAFASPQWTAIRIWMDSLLQACLPEGGHLVIIDHAGLHGLPLHVAVRPGWTVSYAADWTAVVEAARQGAMASQMERGHISLVHVLGATEAARTIDAVATSDRRLIAAAEAAGWSIEQLSGSAATADAICSQFGRADAIRLIAHGFVRGETNEVSLIVSADGRLPPRSGAAFDATGMTAYRLGFDRLASIDRAPPLLFLGACSAGRVNERGQQERLGLFMPLSAAGLETMIAPRWPINAPRTLPLLDDIVERCMHGTAPARAVAEVTAAAVDSGAVDWLAHSFCLEGRWT